MYLNIFVYMVIKVPCANSKGFFACVAGKMKPVLNGTGGSLKREIIIV